MHTWNDADLVIQKNTPMPMSDVEGNRIKNDSGCPTLAHIIKDNKHCRYCREGQQNKKF